MLKVIGATAVVLREIAPGIPTKKFVAELYTRGDDDSTAIPAVLLRQLDQSLKLFMTQLEKLDPLRPDVKDVEAEAAWLAALLRCLLSFCVVPRFFEAKIQRIVESAAKLLFAVLGGRVRFIFPLCSRFVWVLSGCGFF